MKTRNIRIGDWANRPKDLVYYVPSKRNKDKGIRVILEGENYSPEEIMFTKESKEWGTDALAIHIIELVKSEPLFRIGICDTTMLILNRKNTIIVEACACDSRHPDVWVDLPVFRYKKSKLTFFN